MKTKSLLLAFLIFGAFSGVVANDNDPVLMTIGGVNVTKSEFEYIYNKNNTNSAVDKKSLDEYVELFTKFKLKVVEAQNQGLDTLPAFKSELSGYRTQLAKPYLTDGSVEEKLVREAYERMKTEVEVAHVLIRLSEEPTAADTLSAFKKATAVRERLLKEDFSKVAAEVSEDPSVAQNKGYLGFLSGGMSVYPFEMGMFKTPVGEISQPIRTYYGYHIIKVLSTRPSRGMVRVEHIMKFANDRQTAEQNAQAKQQIDSIYQQVVGGAKFEELAKQYSDDKGSAKKGGDLSWFGIGRMVKEFEDAAFALTEKGQISEPILSPFGWHIIKLIDRKGIESYERKHSEIVQSLQYDERGGMPKQAFVAKLKNIYNLQVNADAVEELVNFVSVVSLRDSLFMQKSERLSKMIMTFADQKFIQSDVAAFMYATDFGDPFTPRELVANKLDKYIEKTLLEYEDAQLEKKYPEFRNLMNEYHDGILLFDISNKEVWDKATKDTEGLEKFFASNKEQYAWDQPRYKGRVFRCKDEASAKAVKQLLKKVPSDSLDSYLKTRINNDSVIYVKSERGIWKKGENGAVDKLAFKVKGADEKSTSDYPIVFVSGKLLKQYPEVYTDVRGIVTTDYQNFLEEKWVKNLMSKYKVEINEQVLNEIIQQHVSTK